MPKKVPMRQCLGCREMKPKRELTRVVRSPEAVSYTHLPEGAVAISGRHLQSVPAAVKMVCTDCVCSGAQ